MEFLTAEQKSFLQQILRRSPLLQTADDRRSFLTFCGLEKYCSSLNLDTSFNRFFISIFASSLLRDKIRVGNVEKLALVVFLEYISQVDTSLSTDDQEFLQSIINLLNQWNRRPHSPVSPEPRRPSPANVGTPTKNREPIPTRQNSTVPQQSVFTVSYTIALGQKIWYVLLIIVIIWFFVGQFSQRLVDVRGDQMLIALLVSGAVGGLLSGLGGWLARLIVVGSFQWEQGLMSSTIGLMIGAISWMTFGMITGTDILRNDGQLIGLVFGLITVVLILCWLNLISSRT